MGTVVVRSETHFKDQREDSVSTERSRWTVTSKGPGSDVSSSHSSHVAAMSL